jgi:hypothetical protein
MSTKETNTPAPEKLPSPAESQPESATGFDIATIRLDTDFAARSRLERPLLSLPIRKPGRHDFVRTHGDPAFSLDVGLLRIRDEQEEIFVVTGSMVALLEKEIRPSRLFLTATATGVIAVWPVNLPRGGGNTDGWSASALQIAEMAKTQWVSCRSNLSLGAYEATVGVGGPGEPVWPKKSFAELLEIAFRGRIIATTDHPAVRRLSGEF